jgi:hypothetical protein
VTINYVGNHGYHETVQFSGVNGFDGTGTFTSLPATAPDSRFTTVDQVQTVGVSNYNGLVISVQHHFNHGLQLQGNFSWSHALDEISNGGFLGFSQATAGGQITVQPVNNNNLRQFNYGNADYDTRKYGSISYVYEVPFRFGPKSVMQGWQVSGTLFSRSGLPYTAYDLGTRSQLENFGYLAPVYANYTGAALPSCGGSAASAAPPSANPCLPAADFSASPNGYGAQRRNQLSGPGYFDTDFTVMKFTNIPRWEGAKVGMGVQFFNLFNHPNFDQPNNSVSDPALFGTITRTVNTPTSILGSFLGGDASPRLIQLTAKLNF